MNGEFNFWLVFMEVVLRPGIIEALIGGLILVVGIRLDSKRFTMLIVLVNLLTVLAILGDS